MRTTLRFIGGPKHGETTEVSFNPSLHNEVVVPVSRPVRLTPATEDRAYYEAPLYVRYELRTVILGTVKVQVLAPHDVRDNELSRRLADFIEGTDPNRHGRI